MNKTEQLSVQKWTRPGSGSFEALSASPDAAWYPLQTRHQCERRVDAALRDEGFESFVPVRLERRQWSDRSKLVWSPLFPGYTFVRMEINPRSINKVMRIPGMVRFVSLGREPLPVSHAEMEAIRALVRSKEKYEAGPFPVVGERVRIRGGCLEGVEGILTGHVGRKEIAVSIGSIQKSLKIALGSYRVERVA